jgi:hypothetical protein
MVMTSKKYKDIECHKCGTPFSPKSTSAKYCNKRCMYQARKVRREASDDYKYNIRKSNLKRKYNITPEEFDDMLEVQNNCCAICLEHKSSFDISLCQDHCHYTGRNRGILCNNCNRAIGLLGDDLEKLTNAVTYLSRWQDD